MEYTLSNIPETQETCPKCGNTMNEGDLVHMDWAGNALSHINCEAIEVTDVTLEAAQDAEGLAYYR